MATSEDIKMAVDSNEAHDRGLSGCRVSFPCAVVGVGVG